MDYISGEEYSRAEASNAYKKANNLEEQVKELTFIVKNLQIDVNNLKKKIKGENICSEDDYEPWFHPFKD